MSFLSHWFSFEFLKSDSEIWGYLKARTRCSFACIIPNFDSLYLLNYFEEPHNISQLNRKMTLDKNQGMFSRKGFCTANVSVWRGAYLTGLCENQKHRKNILWLNNKNKFAVWFLTYTYIFMNHRDFFRRRVAFCMRRSLCNVLSWNIITHGFM